jgi:hypothetical protein
VAQVYALAQAMPARFVALRGGLEFGPPKSDAGLRSVTLPEAALAALRPHMLAHVAADPEALVFTGEKGKPLRTETSAGPSGGQCR